MLGCSFGKARYLSSKKTKNEKAPLKYKEYIVSDFWKKRKQKFFTKYKKECTACLSEENINLHHMHYGNYGNEPDEWLVALCKNCHEEFHTNYELSANMTKDTNDFIIQKRENLDFPFIR